MPGEENPRIWAYEVAVAHPQTVSPTRRGLDQAAAAGLPTRIPEHPEIKTSPGRPQSR
jgi:hypothetical protein